jgi:hypothetical protein
LEKHGSFFHLFTPTGSETAGSCREVTEMRVVKMAIESTRERCIGNEDEAAILDLFI